MTKQRRLTCELCDNLDGINNTVKYQHLNEDNAYDWYRCEEHFDEELSDDPSWSEIT